MWRGRWRRAPAPANDSSEGVGRPATVLRESPHPLHRPALGSPADGGLYRSTQQWPVELTGRGMSGEGGYESVWEALSHRDRLEILERISRGETQPRVAGALGTTERTVGRVLAAAGGSAVAALAPPAALAAAAVADRARGDPGGDRGRRLVSGDREADRQGAVDGQPRGRRRRGPRRLSGDAGGRSRLPGRAQAQARPSWPATRGCAGRSSGCSSGASRRSRSRPD